MAKLAIVYGDERQQKLGERLEARGWVISHIETNDVQVITPALDGAQVVLLPVPATRDGATVFRQENTGILFSDLLSHLLPGTLLLGGLLPAQWVKSAREKGIAAMDYYQSELVQLQNALPTAEGAIRLAMQALPVTLFGARIGIVGYGRIGSLLAEKLTALGAKVGVLARSPVALAQAAMHGAEAFSFAAGVPPFFADCRVLFNTVPSRVLDQSFLCALPKTCHLIELASPPGGFAPELAEKLQLRVIDGRGIPGRFYPETAGEILAASVCEILSANGFVC